MDYDLELNRIVSEVKKLNEERRTKSEKPIKVCLQFPDGLKAEATKAVEQLKLKTKNQGLKTEFFIWSGSNFGGCDYPWYLKDLGFDLLINFGHSVFKKWPT
ncbi:MAG: hypothetical protein HY438_00570 [DPANN group archaeon]|nr:hypothetical protein [DPANN group archaeon]